MAWLLCPDRFDFFPLLTSPKFVLDGHRRFGIHWSPGELRAQRASRHSAFFKSCNGNPGLLCGECAFVEVAQGGNSPFMFFGCWLLPQVSIPLLQHCWLPHGWGPHLTFQRLKWKHWKVLPQSMLRCVLESCFCLNVAMVPQHGHHQRLNHRLLKIEPAAF